MWINKESNPEELAKLRESLKSQMRDTRAVVYDLRHPSWHGAFADFPLMTGDISYTETAYWENTARGPGEHLAAERANIIIGTSSAEGLDNLRRRYWVPSATDATSPVGKFVTIVLDDVDVKTTPFVVTPSGRAFAELRDGDTFIIVVLRGLDQIPDEITITPVSSYEHLIEHWDSL